MVAGEKWVAGCVVVVVASLLLVGIVSGTIIRHAVQVTPGVILLALLLREIPWASHAAMALFAFWFFIMVLIWLWLLGLARIVTGEFSPTEVTLTLSIGLGCVVGFVAACRVRSRAGWALRIGAFLLFAALQVGAMWASLQPVIATR